MIKYFQNRLKSFSFAFQGLKYVFLTQPNFRIQLVVSICLIILGAFLKITELEWLALCMAMTSLLVSECFNTALESLTDLVSSEYHPLAKIAKDVSAGAVLLAAASLIVISCFIFIPKVLA